MTLNTDTRPSAVNFSNRIYVAVQNISLCWHCLTVLLYLHLPLFNHLKSKVLSCTLSQTRTEPLQGPSTSLLWASHHQQDYLSGGHFTNHPAHPILQERLKPSYHIRRISPVSVKMNQLSFMQLQTQSGHKRPSTGGHSDSSSSTNSNGSNLSSSVSSGSSTPKTSCDLDIVRCSRCQRSLSIDPTGRSNNAVRFGMNSFYCSRCATVVGYK
jgi:hypothetical protein